MAGILEKVSKSQDLSALSVAELNELAAELRNYILEVVSENGGHLAPNLGVVELTVALHKALDLPNDKIVWDVGHQCYAHKILSGRYDEFRTLRKEGGLSGFPKRHESAYDAFVAGHSGTSVSAAVGLAQAAKLNNENRRVVAVIGDGALTGGEVYEALNHGGDLKTPFTVILNDNKMSIAENVGAMSRYLVRMRSNKRYQKLKQKITHQLLKGGERPSRFYRVLRRFRDTIKYIFIQGIYFEEMGFVYLGPIDGHNIEEILHALRRAADITKPTLIHVLTEKGHGYAPAVNDPTAFHGTGAFDLATGKQKKSGGKSYTACFSESLMQAAAKDEKICAITAAMPDGTGLADFAKAYPERFFDVGIAEQHAATFSAALAAEGLKPVFAVYSTFLQRAYDQVLHDICLQDLPVMLAVDRGGVVGDDGETHQGVFDLAFLRSIPNMTVAAAADGTSLQKLLPVLLSHNGPTALRYPRGAALELELPEWQPEIGKGRLLREPENGAAAILAVGPMLEAALNAADALAAEGINVAVADLVFVKPLDEELVLHLARKYQRLLVIEDGVIAGGAGSAVLEFLAQREVAAQVELCGYPDEFVLQGTQKQIYARYGLTAEGLIERIKNTKLY